MCIVHNIPHEEQQELDGVELAPPVLVDEERAKDHSAAKDLYEAAGHDIALT
jgi:hypothetical protein